MVAHREDERIVGVEHGRSRRRQRLDQLALFAGDRLHRTERTDVVAADGRHDADRRTNQCQRQVDHPGAVLADPDLLHVVVITRTHAQQRRRRNEVLVVVFRRFRAAESGREHTGDEFLRGRLAAAAGDGNEFAVSKQRPVRAEERRGRDAADARGIPLLPAVDPGDETAERPGAFDAGEQTAHCASPSATGDPRKPSVSGTWFGRERAARDRRCAGEPRWSRAISSAVASMRPFVRSIRGQGLPHRRYRSLA